MQITPSQAMKTTSLALIIGLASLMVAESQTNLTAPEKAVGMQSDPTNSVPQTVLVAESQTNLTNSANPIPSAAASIATTTNPAPTTNMVTGAQANLTNSADSKPTVALSSTSTNPVSTTTTEPTADTNNSPAIAAIASIPQIRFSDVPITTAIENLARLANINYMLDPKIGYGLPDANGQVKVEPVLSIRWENISAENALLSLLENYGLQIIHDKHTGIDRITLKDPAAPPPLFTKVVQLKYASVSNMIEAAQSVLIDKRSKVLTDNRTSQLVVVATDPEQQAVDALVAQLDKPTRQVLIETRLVEINSNPKVKRGVDWTGTLQGQNVSFGNGTMSGSWTTVLPGTPVNTTLPGGRTITTTPDNTQSGTLANTLGNGGFSWNTKSGLTPNIGFLNADGMNAVLSFLNSSSDAQVVSTPRIVTLDNQTAKIQVSRTYPVFQVSAGTQVSAGGSSVTYSNVGTTLKVTPRISANDYIWMHILPEVSSFFGNFSQQTAAGTLSAPVFDSRSCETEVLVPNSNTLVIGGLVKDNPNASYTKVPLLGDIPGLGLLFRSEDKQVDKDNLIIFITPTIVKDSDFQTSHSGDFLKSKPTTMKSPLNPNGIWDSSERAGHWTDPINDAAK
jgi:type II secretory pathway component HofQ